MKISTTTTGIFPKIARSTSSGQGGDAPSLRANLHKFDRGEISAAELEEILQKNIERTVREQISVGIDLPTDGLIRWTDLFSPFVAAWEGITRRGIHRFYDTNTLYGEPVVEAELTPQRSKGLTFSKISADFEFAKKFGAKKATLPGVFTFAAACVDNFYRDSKKLRGAIAANLLEEARNLITAGAEIIEIHEPELAWNMEHGTWNNEVLEIYKKFGELNVKIIVVSYFRNFSPEIASTLIKAGCGVGIDFSQPTEISALPENSILQAGVVNSRETKLEDAEGLKKLRNEILAKFANASEIIFSTTSHVEYLPHSIAIQKIELLKNLK
ncbi:hypothetical protein KKF38_02720 [Patescibacteria group bacterium]|nr:hypothetical protein [Patescibacteria group bacterium]